MYVENPSFIVLYNEKPVNRLRGTQIIHNLPAVVLTVPVTPSMQYLLNNPCSCNFTSVVFLTYCTMPSLFSASKPLPMETAI